MSSWISKPSTYALGIVFPVLCAVAVALRVRARSVKNVAYGPDDWMSLAALVFTVGCGVVLIIGAATDTIGQHSPAQLQQSQQETIYHVDQQIHLIQVLETAFYALNILALACVRLTFLLMYRRIFRGPIFKTFNWAIIVLVACWTVAFFFVNIFGCGTHFEGKFSSEGSAGYSCINGLEWTLTMAASDLLLDLAVLAIPVGPIYQLNMKTAKKVGLWIVFSVGIISVAFGIMRLVSFVTLIQHELICTGFTSTTDILGLGPRDRLGVISMALYWSYLELGVGCFIANVLALPGLLMSQKHPLNTFFE